MEEEGGRQWGDIRNPPVLALHGWLDNAGTFDTLIPHLPPDNCYIAVDLPGHGFSSHLPKGMLYSSYDYLTTVRRIQKHFQWPKFSLMGHSLGSMISFLYSGTYPNDVVNYIAIDLMKPLSMKMDKSTTEAREIILEFFKYVTFKQENEKQYTASELTDSMKKGLNNSNEITCKILMKRGASKKSNGFYVLTRDPRLKADRNFTPFGFTQSDCIQFADQIICNVLIIKSSDTKFYEPKQNFFEVLNIIKVKSKYMEFVSMPGSHHLHLDSPEKVAPVICSFLEKVRAKRGS